MQIISIKSAINAGCIELIDLLLKYGATIHDDYLYYNMSNCALLELLIDHVTINERHINQCYKGNDSLKIVQLFLDKQITFTNNNIAHCAFLYYTKPDMLCSFIKLFAKYGINLRFNQDWLLQFCISYNLTNCCRTLLNIDGIQTDIFDTNDTKTMISYLLKNDYCPRMKLFLNRHINFYCIIYQLSTSKLWMQPHTLNQTDFNKKWTCKFITDAKNEDYIKIKDQYLTPLWIDIDNIHIIHKHFYKSKFGHYLFYMKLDCNDFAMVNIVCITHSLRECGNTNDCIIFTDIKTDNDDISTKIFIYASNGYTLIKINRLMNIDMTSYKHVTDSVLNFIEQL